MDDPERTKPIGLARYANEFYVAALGADDKLGVKPGFETIAPVPVLYLVGHSIELSLKAFLLNNGVTLRELRHLSHDLNKSLVKAKELGLDKIVVFDDHELGAFSALNNLYSKKQLEYMVSGYKQFPIFGPLQSMCKKLLKTVSLSVGYVNPG